MRPLFIVSKDWAQSLYKRSRSRKKAAIKGNKCLWIVEISVSQVGHPSVRTPITMLIDLVE